MFAWQQSTESTEYGVLTADSRQQSEVTVTTYEDRPVCYLDHSYNIERSPVETLYVVE